MEEIMENIDTFEDMIYDLWTCHSGGV